MTGAAQDEPQRVPLARQVAAFGIIGGLSTCAHVIVALMLASAELSPLSANLGGYLSAVTVSYVGNALFTFRSRLWRGGQVLRFAAVSLAGLGLGQAITYLLTDVFRAAFGWALGVVVILVPAFSFVTLRLWAFAARREPPVVGRQATDG